jgi:hypothetical protein
MTIRVCLCWLLACTVATSAGIAYAGPEECLTLRDNVAVAGCANKYAPGTPGPAPSAPRPASRIVRQPIQAAEQWLLFPVPSPVSHTVEPSREPQQSLFSRDRTELIARAKVGAIALAGLGLVFGLWRWRASLVKTCSFCGTRVAPGAVVCRRCFRSV